MMNLVLALHCHQPVGNFDKVFNLAVDKCYQPVLKLLEDHPGIHCGLHFSGCLLEWLEEHRPEVLDLLAVLVGRDQVEPLSGGFYEPLLATIPARDARGQMEMLNGYLASRLGRRPTGFWLTERIWDPALPATLAGTNLEYTIVDDTHFYYAGLKWEDIFGPYVTEREGHTLKILATPMVMRYMIPFYRVEEVMARLREWDQAGHHLAVYGDDGEKFGLWPGTHEWVLEKGWLKSFFEAVEGNRDWLRAVTPSEYLAGARPLGRLYMPQASYEEMTEWALPTERTLALEDIIGHLKYEDRWESWRPFVRGGTWDNFLVKYEESNRMHKKMVFLSGLAGDDLEIRKTVWRAQCNCAYWHGVFGGLYMGHLRRAIHRNLILAQGGLTAKNKGVLTLHRLDYDKDGLEEILIYGPNLSLGLAPGQGGSLFEICHVPKALNLSDTLTRRPEPYHRRLPEAVVVTPDQDGQVASIHDQVKAKEADLERFLVFDPRPRASLVDHFLEKEVAPEELAGGRYQELGDFPGAFYTLTGALADQARAVVGLVRQGRVGPTNLELSKTVTVGHGPYLYATYRFENQGDQPLQAWFGCEFNLTVFSDRDEHRFLLAPEQSRRREIHETGAEYDLTRFDLINGGDHLKMSFTLSRPVQVFFYPIMTVSMSEDGFEKSYQGTALYFFLPLNLAPGQKDGFRLELALVDI
jgi:alpha-amylase